MLLLVGVVNTQKVPEEGERERVEFKFRLYLAKLKKL